MRKAREKYSYSTCQIHQTASSNHQPASETEPSKNTDEPYLRTAHKTTYFISTGIFQNTGLEGLLHLTLFHNLKNVGRNSWADCSDVTRTDGMLCSSACAHATWVWARACEMHAACAARWLRSITPATEYSHNESKRNETLLCSFRQVLATADVWLS